ncbi:uncharacterized protein LOC112017838 [Quercus suber]|uniref:uncharacterized protein LOC112017838 n=1 Tax=Quercus suber TaxID=58331 RepID=UPI000CE21915|nr:uncharacterized protein LOC112017838 [Quercus suber]
MARTGEQQEDRRSKPPARRFTSFTLLNMPIDQVLMQIKDEGALMFPSKLKGDPSKRSRDKYCYFYCDHGHDTSDYYNLRQQIEALIRQGKLQRFISKDRTDQPQEQPTKRENEHPRPLVGDIRMIIGGTTTSGFVLKMARIDNLAIGFTEEDVSASTTQMTMRLSSADILYYPAFQQMRIDKERLAPVNTPLVGFGGTRVLPLSAVTLPITVSDYPQQIAKDVTFLVVNCSFAYNAILGRPTLNSWKAVTSTYHLMIKFPTEYGVGEERGDQVAARKCYIAMLKMDDHLQTMCIEE